MLGGHELELATTKSVSRLRARRLVAAAAGVTTLAAAVTFAAGVTVGLFSSAGHASGSNTFSAGVVSFGSPVATTCTINPMSPGDASTGWTPAGTDATCTLQATYSGSIPAYLGLDMTITGVAGTPVTPYGGTTPAAAAGLFDGTANGLQMTVTDGTPTTFLSNTSYKNQAGTAVTLSATSSVQGLLVRRASFTSGTTETITVNYQLPTSASNAYNSASTTIVLLVHAVQANNNPLPSGCAAGAVCTSGFNWS